MKKIILFVAMLVLFTTQAECASGDVFTIKVNGVTISFRIGMEPSYEGDEGIVYLNSKYKNPCIPTETSGAVIVPELVTYNGNVYEVRSSAFAFNGCKNITKVTLPNTFKSIDGSMFSDCKSLKEVILSPELERIGLEAFRDCNSLENFVIPTSVKSIGTMAFSRCSSLTSIEIPAGVTEINSAVFEYCTNLSSFVIPEQITRIGSSAFSNCRSLKHIRIPKNVASIENKAFDDCDNLESIVVDEENQNYDSRDNCNAIIEKATNALVFGCKNSVIPEGITAIKDWAFANISSLTSIVIPETVTEIGIEAFYSCESLETINIPSGVKRIEDNTFAHCRTLSRITLPDGVTFIGNSAFYDTSLASIDIPESVTQIADYAFSSCKKLESITMREGLESIGVMVFSYCESLKDHKIKVPMSVKSIGKEAFDYCGATIYIPHHIDNIDELQSITNPSNKYYDTFISYYKPAKSFTTLSFCKSLDFTDMEGVTVYIASAYDKKSNTVTLKKVKQAGAGEGIIIQAAVGSMLNLKVPTTTVAPFTTNYLKGIATDIEIKDVESEYTVYVFKDDKFVKAASGTITKGTAYLQIPASLAGSDELQIRYSSSDDFIAGDANGDGRVNVADIVEAINAMNGKASAKFKFSNADMNNDGTIDKTDINMVMNIIIGNR